MNYFVPSDVINIILDYVESMERFERKQIINTCVKHAKLVLVLKYMFSAIGPPTPHLNYQLLLDVLKHLDQNEIIPF